MEKRSQLDPAVDLHRVVRRIIDVRAQVPARRSALVAITGIDGCGKGHLSARLRDALTARGHVVGVIGIDGWLNLPHRRFCHRNPAEHFYRYAIRFDEMFDQLVHPLRDQRSIWLEADYAEETATTYRRYVYQFHDVDIVLLEGIYLLKRSFQAYYDHAVWIDCTFETALERAIARGQEGLAPEATVRAYRTIYFPAQLLHFELDQPRRAATMIVNNDPRLDDSP